MAEQDEIINLYANFDTSAAQRSIDAFARHVEAVMKNLQAQVNNFKPPALPALPTLPAPTGTPTGAPTGTDPARARALREEAALVRALTAAEAAAANAATSASRIKTNAANAATAAVKAATAAVQAETAAQKANTDASLQSLRANTAATNAQNANLRANAAAARLAQQSANGLRQGLENISAAGQRAGFALSALVTAPLVALANRAFEASNKLEGARALLNSVTKDAAVTEAQIKALNKSAELPALDLPLALEASAKLQGLKFSFQESQKTIETWSNAVALSGGSLADTREITNQLTQALGKNKLELEDLQVIGARIPTLMGIIQQRFGSLDKFKKLPATEGVRLLTEELQKLDKATPKASDRLENVWLAVDRALAPIGKTIADTLIPALEKAVPYLDKFAAYWESLPQSTRLAALGLAGVAAAIGPLLVAGAGVASLVTTFVQFGALFAEGAPLAGAGATLASLAAPVAALVAGAAAIYLAYQSNFAGVKDVLDDALKSFENARQTVVKFWTDNEATFKQALANIRSALESFINFARPAWEAFSSALALATKGAWGTIKLEFQEGFTVVSGTVKAIAQLVNGDWSAAMQTFSESGLQSQRRFNDGMKGVLTTARNTLLSIVGDTLGFAANLVKAWGTALDKTHEAIKTGLAKLVELFGIAQDSVLGKLREKLGAWYEAGRSLGVELRDGLIGFLHDFLPASISDALDAVMSVSVFQAVERAMREAQRQIEGFIPNKSNEEARRLANEQAREDWEEELISGPRGAPSRRGLLSQPAKPKPAPTATATGAKGKGSAAAADLQEAQKAAIDAAKDQLRLLDEQRATEEQHLRLALEAKEISASAYYAQSLAMLDAYNLKYAAAQASAEAAISSATSLRAAERANQQRDFMRQAFAASEARWQEERRLEIERANSEKEFDALKQGNRLAALKQQDDLQLAEIKRMAEARVLTHAEAQRRIEEIEKAAAARALAAKQAELAAAPAEDAKRQEELAAEILILQNEERARIAALGNVRREARQKDLAQQQAEAAQDRALDASIISARIAAAKAQLAQLEALGGSGAQQRALRLQLAQLELEEVRTQSAERVRLIEQERDATLDAERAKLEALRAAAAADPDSQNKIDEQIAKLEKLTAKYRELTAAIEEKAAADEAEAQRQENLAANQDERSAALANIAGVGSVLQEALSTLDKGVKSGEKSMVKFGVIAGGVFSQIARQMAATGKIGEALWKGLANFAAQGALAALKAWESAKRPEWIKSGLEQAAAAYAAFASFNVPSGILHGLASAGYFALAGGALSGVAGGAISAVSQSGQQKAAEDARTQVAVQNTAANTDPRIIERPVQVELRIDARTEQGTLLKINNEALAHANGLFRSLVASTAVDGPIAI